MSIHTQGGSAIQENIHENENINHARRQLINENFYHELTCWIIGFLLTICLSTVWLYSVVIESEYQSTACFFFLVWTCFVGFYQLTHMVNMAQLAFCFSMFYVFYYVCQMQWVKPERVTWYLLW